MELSKLQIYLKKTMLEIAKAVLAEFGGPMPEKSAEFFYGLEKNGVIELIKKGRGLEE